MNTEIIWQSTLDDKYECIVYRIENQQSRGQLIVKNINTGEIILDKEVALSYGAQFGPDIADIGEWQEMIIDAVDNKKI